MRLNEYIKKYKIFISNINYLNLKIQLSTVHGVEVEPGPYVPQQFERGNLQVVREADVVERVRA